MVTRYDLLKRLAGIIPDDVLVVGCIGNTSGFWGQLTDRETNLFHITLGMCTATALGLALALPKRRVMALDADGNLLLNLGTLGTVANHSPANLTSVVFDNGNYLGSNKGDPGMPTASGGKLNLEGVARASGIGSACTVQNEDEFQEKVQAALAQKGPHVIVAKIEAVDKERPPRVRRLQDPRENKYRFANYIQKSEGVEILGSGLGKWS